MMRRRDRREEIQIRLRLADPCGWLCGLCGRAGVVVLLRLLWTGLVAGEVAGLRGRCTAPTLRSWLERVGQACCYQCWFAFMLLARMLEAKAGVVTLAGCSSSPLP